MTEQTDLSSIPATDFLELAAAQAAEDGAEPVAVRLREIARDAAAVQALDAWVDAAGSTGGRSWTLKRYQTTRGVSYVVNWCDSEARFEREKAGDTAAAARIAAAAALAG